MYVLFEYFINGILQNAVALIVLKYSVTLCSSTQYVVPSKLHVCVCVCVYVQYIMH